MSATSNETKSENSDLLSLSFLGSQLFNILAVVLEVIVFAYFLAQQAEWIANSYATVAFELVAGALSIYAFSSWKKNRSLSFVLGSVAVLLQTIFVNIIWALSSGADLTTNILEGMPVYGWYLHLSDFVDGFSQAADLIPMNWVARVSGWLLPTFVQIAWLIALVAYFTTRSGSPKAAVTPLTVGLGNFDPVAGSPIVGQAPTGPMTYSSTVAADYAAHEHSQDEK